MGERTWAGIKTKPIGNRNMKIYGVIGANYGDEGKGMVSANIRHYSDPAKTVTVLTNGGAQRGHTVDAKDGSKFVFHHLGSSQKGDPNITFCPASYIINPLVLMQDLDKAEQSWDTLPEVYIDGYCLVTTPYDMMANQVEEIMAGDWKWGSTGMGIWHTKHRSTKIMMDANMLFDFAAGHVGYGEIANTLGRIQNYWLSEYFRGRDLPEIYQHLFENGNLKENWIQDVAYLFNERVHQGVPPWGFRSREGICDTVIFENAQGLMLSQERGRNTTPSNTGSATIKDLISRYGLRPTGYIDMNYVTRTYLTRHGAGVLPGECPQEFINVEMFDGTNLYNDWQGSLRYGLLDEKALMQRVEGDLDVMDNGMNVKANIIFTHENEAPIRITNLCPHDRFVIVGVDNPYMTEDAGLCK